MAHRRTLTRERLGPYLARIEVEIAQVQGAIETLEGELEDHRSELRTLQQVRELLVGGSDVDEQDERPVSFTPETIELVTTWVFDHSQLDAFTISEAMESLEWPEALVDVAFRELRARQIIRLAGQSPDGEYIFRLLPI